MRSLTGQWDSVRFIGLFGLSVYFSMCSLTVQWENAWRNKPVYLVYWENSCYRCGTDERQVNIELLSFWSVNRWVSQYEERLTFYVVRLQESEMNKRSDENKRTVGWNLMKVDWILMKSLMNIDDKLGGWIDLDFTSLPFLGLEPLFGFFSELDLCWC